MNTDERILVVGTTPDYVHMLEREHPGRCLFVTDPGMRAAAREPAPAAAGEIVGPLDEPQAVLARLTGHLRRHSLRLNGIACFDCESMPLAAELGERLGLDYPSPRSIAMVRNKYATTRRWRQVGLPAPQSALVGSEADVETFFRQVRGPLVLKPLSGSGSELVFACRSEAESLAAFRILRSRLAVHPDSRMYAPVQAGEDTVDPRRVFVAEELVDGIELSADFVVDQGEVRIIRVCRKIPLADEPLGTVHAYVVSPELPNLVPLSALRRQLAAAAESLGLERAICVVDMVAREGELVMLELAPRLAGDCLPILTRASSGLHVLSFALDFAGGTLPPIAAETEWRKLVALRILAPAPGRIRNLDTAALLADPRVVRVHLVRTAGDFVSVPPDSNDLRVIGYVIFQPAGDASLEEQCRELSDALVVELEPVAAGALDSGGGSKAAGAGG